MTELKVKGMYSKKTGKMCHALILDLGYRTVALSWDPQLCAEVLGISVAELYRHTEPYSYDVIGYSGRN